MKIIVDAISNLFCGWDETKASLKNFLPLFLNQIISLLLQIVMSPYIVRTVGPEKYGLIAFAQAFMQYFILLDVGINLSGVRAVSVARGDAERISEVFSIVMLIRLIFLITGFCVTCAVVVGVEKFREDWTIYLISYGVVVGNVLSPLFLFQGLEKMKYILISNLTNVAANCLTFLFVRAEKDFMAIPLIGACGALAGGITALCIARGKIKVRFRRPQLDRVKHFLKEGRDFSFAGIAGALYHNSRIFAMGLFASKAVSGYYAMAERMMSLMVVFPFDSLIQGAYPRISRIFSQDPGRAFKSYAKFQAATLAYYSMALLLSAFYAPALVRVVFGTSYPVAVDAYRWLCPGIWITILAVLRLYFFLIAGRGDIYSNLCTVAGLVGCLPTLIMAFYFSYRGVAITYALMSLFVLLASVGYQKKLRQLKRIKIDQSSHGL